MTEQEKYKMRCMAVDDEPFALRLIADDIRKVPFLELVRTCPTPMEALDHLRKDPVDLLFLDIQMPVMKGTEFLRILDRPPLVIITTAFEQYALEGFELHAIDYLVKPIPFERFLKAVTRARDQYLLLHAKTTEKRDGTFFFVHSEYRKLKIFHHEILYIEGLKDYVKIFLTSQSRPVLTRLNLKAIESKLHAELIIFEKDVPKIRIGQKVRFTLANETAERMATVYLIGREISTDRTIRIHCHLDKEDPQLLPGMYLKAIVEAGSTKVAALPNEAIVDFQGKKYIFIEAAEKEEHNEGPSEEGHHFQIIEIQTGNSELGYTEVMLPENISKETDIVVKGAYALLSKMKNSEEEGHAH